MLNLNSPTASAQDRRRIKTSDDFSAGRSSSYFLTMPFPDVRNREAKELPFV